MALYGDGTAVPLAGEHSNADRIRLERLTNLFALLDRADLVIDNSPLTVPDLKRLLTGSYRPRSRWAARFCHVYGRIQG